MLRLFDIVMAGLGLIGGSPIFVLLAILGFFDTGSPLFFQTRVGRRQKIFTLVKFRTMQVSTPSISTHLVDAANVTRIGRFLRKSKLDELPQLWNVLRGEMSLVGPRPCLPIQMELIDERRKRGIFEVRPGITGLAQINSIDMSDAKLLAETDAKMLKDLSLIIYWKYIIATILGGGFGDRIKHEND